MSLDRVGFFSVFVFGAAADRGAHSDITIGCLGRFWAVQPFL